MSPETCDACGRSVKIAGAFANVWKFDQGTSGGMTLELSDGSEHFLCRDCIGRLPDDEDLTAEDVAALSEE